MLRDWEFPFRTRGNQKNIRFAGMEKVNENIRWYALKVFFNKVFDVEKILTDEGVESYIPCTLVQVEKNGVKKEERRPVIPSLMFFRSTVRFAEKTQSVLRGRAMVYTNINREGRRTPAPISDYEMNMFRFVTSSGEEGLDFFGDSAVTFRVGDRVRVTGGVFQGAVGHICRIKGKKRLLVSVTGVCAVATSFIPNCFLQKMDEDEEKPANG